jgi:predicted ABC-type ATPase
MANPKLYFIAGRNGSGKTTFDFRFLPYYADCSNFVDADWIASGLSPFSPAVAAIKAGKLMLDEINAVRKQSADFTFETTLAERTSGALLKEMRENGCEVQIYYLWFRSVHLALERVANRVVGYARTQTSFGSKADDNRC